MNATDELVAQNVRRLLDRHGADGSAHATPADTMPVELWRALTDAGLSQALVTDVGGDARDALRSGVTILQECAYRTVQVPLAEAMLVNWLAASVGWDPETGFVSVAIAADLSRQERSADRGSTAPATLARIPWGRAAGAVYALALDADSYRVARVEAGHWTMRCGINLAGEPRDTLELDAGAFDTARISTAQVDPLCVLAMAALLRAAQMVGAMERTLDLALDHARTRVQFGRPISGFQAVQQMLAQHASHVAAAAAAVDLAVDAWGSNDAILCAGIAKSRAGEAAGLAAECAHQVIAAMGYAMEHPLQLATRRLWSWRDEYGNEAFWNERTGADVLAAGAENAWALLADRTTSSFPQMP